MIAFAKAVAVPFLVVLLLVGIAAIGALAWMLLPELRKSIRTELRRAIGLLRRRRTARA